MSFWKFLDPYDRYGKLVLGTILILCNKGVDDGGTGRLNYYTHSMTSWLHHLNPSDCQNHAKWSQVCVCANPQLSAGSASDDNEMQTYWTSWSLEPLLIIGCNAMHLSIESSLQLRDTAQSQKSFLSFYNHGISNKFGPVDQEPWARKF